MLTPLGYYVLLGALRCGADVIPVLQRWELRLREVSALAKGTQLLYY